MILSFRSKVTPTAFLGWFALCTTAKPAWFPTTLPKSNSKLEVEFPYPFEVVLRTWENGPPDPQFIRLVKLFSLLLNMESQIGFLSQGLQGGG